MLEKTRHPLHLVCGPPGSGKSTYGAKLASRLSAAFLDSDQATQRLIRAGLEGMGLSPDDRDSPTYKRLFREAVYETLFDLTDANLPQVPVIIAGPFTRESGDPDWPQRLQIRFNTEVIIHFVHAPPLLRRDRIAARGETRDLPKLAAWDTYAASCREGPPPFPHILVDGTADDWNSASILTRCNLPAE
jgi:predicted kinase